MLTLYIERIYRNHPSGRDTPRCTGARPPAAGPGVPFRRRIEGGSGRLPVPCAPVTFGVGSIRGASESPGEIDYRLARQHLVNEYRRGRLAQHEVCDAHPELLRNARECAEPSRIRCPICEEHNLVLVTYVFGPRLPAGGRCITSKRELQGLAEQAGEFACYVVEVCPECSWNHLARTFVLNPARSA